MLLMNPLDWYRLGKHRFHHTVRRREAPNDEADAAAGTLQHASSLHVPGPARRFLRKHLVPILGMPDEYWPWYFPALRAARRILHRERIDAVVSTGPPWTSHLVGRRLYKEFRIPWLADFRDMWTLDDWRFEYPEWRNHFDRRWEKDCVRCATRIICTTRASRDLMAQAYPAFAEKISVLTNGFDGLALETSSQPSGVSRPVRDAGEIQDRKNPGPESLDPNASSRPILLLHLGRLYIGRRIDTFCQAVQKVIQAQNLAAGQLKVLFLGASDPEFFAQANQVAPELIRDKVIEFAERIPWQEALRQMTKADLLVIIQGKHRLAIPAKLYEYFQTGKPIFAVVAPGALSEMLAELGAGVSADPGDADAIASAIWTALHLPPRTAEHQDRITRQFNYRNLAQTFAGWIAEAAGHS
jgi:glycosyltransferase involved in cell wall biosynthesis